jgi:hypothetical protein
MRLTGPSVSIEKTFSRLTSIHFLSCQEQPRFHDRIGIERHALDTLLDQPAGEVGMVRGTLVY